MKKRLTATSLVLALLHFSSLAKPSDWWQTYDYSQVSAQVVSRGDDTPILRGRAVKLDTDEHAISAFYDVGSMNLRYVTLGSIQFKGTPWDGSHGGNSLIGGELFLQSGTLLAWTENDNWLDPRANDYAPLAKEYVHFKGSYRYNQQAIFHYTVGTQKAEVYEMPQTFYHQGQVVFVRHFQIEATSRPIKLKVLESSSSDLTPQITLHSPYHAIKSRDIINNTHLSEIQYIDIPASNQPQAFYIAYAQSKELPLIEKEDLLSKLSGGTTRWPQTVKLAGKLASDENENFVVDQIPLPIDNPYQSKIRFAGFDFFADGSRAAFSTWNGDVWIASGLDETLQNVTWKRYAAGINEALGIRIVDDIIYVTGKDQITRLHDINNDGEADYYENFNNDIKITANFHEFTFGLQTDDAGNFYFSKASPVKQGGRGFDSTHDNHGVVMKVSADGKNSEVVLSGLRAAGGLSVSPDGSIITTGENEGTYVQACKVNYAKQGDFMGVIHPGNGRTLQQGYTKPLTYLPMQADNSGGGQVWVPEGAWGDLGGSLIHLSYGQSTAYTVLKDEVNGQVQGGVIALPFKLMSSAMRARFNPANNNQLYITGFKGWQTNATLLSAINRITYKGQPFKRVSKLKASTKGLYLTFNHTLDPTSANNLQNYSIQRWNYLYSKQYGSAHFATDIPEKELEKYRNTESKSVGRVGIPSNRSGESVYITAVKLLPDNKTVFLKIQDMKPVDQMKIDYSLLTSKGQELSQTIYNTIYNLTADSIEVADMVSIDTLKEQEKRNAYDLGAKVEVIDEYGNQDTFKSRTLALQVKDTDSVSPFLQPGSFSATYTGYIQVAEKDRVTFQARGNGQLTFELNNKTLINFNGNQQKVTSKVTSLNSGFHAYTIRYRSGNSHPRFLILWNGNKFPLSPVSPLSLRFLSDGAIKKAQIMRDQRSFVAEKRCFNCHSTEIELNMPELQQDSPSLDNIGSRIKQAWMAKWIANPQTLRHQTNMPKLVNNNEAAHIAAYLATKVTSPSTKTMQSDQGDRLLGQGLFYDLGCIGCHTRPDRPLSKSQPRQQHQDAVSAERTSLTHVAAKFKFTALRDYLLEPEANYKWTKMPNFKLNAKEALDLASYLYQASAVKALPTSQGDTTIGQTLYNQNYCANCHSPAQQPKVAIQNFNDGCLSRNTHIDLHMQNRQKWQMSAFLQQEMMTFSRVATHEFAERQINQLQCSSCHVRDDKPSSWASNVSSVQDLKITHKDKGHLDQTRPPLTYTGEKLTPETIGDYLAGDLRYQTRDWLLAKMPAFPARAELLSAGMALQHGQYAQQENLAVNLQLIPEGEKLVSAMGGFSCVICHDIGAQKATAAFEVQGVNLKYSAKRLTPDYFLRWMLDPIHIDPTTKMPKYFDDQEKSAMPVFDHNASKQIEAIHQYLYSIE